jgi:hypothetical protein
MRRPAKGLVDTSSSMAESSEAEEVLARRSRGKKGELVWVGEPERPRVLMDMRRGGIGVEMGAGWGAEGGPETLWERLPKRELKVLEVKEPRRAWLPAVVAGFLSSVMLSCEGVVVYMVIASLFGRQGGRRLTVMSAFSTWRVML